MPTLHYQTGFGNACATEALPGALPVGRNSPQVCPYGLYAEQLSGTAFTAARSENRRSWLYRIRPAAANQQPFEPYNLTGWSNTFGNGPVTPNVLRWDPLPIPTAPTDFIDGITTWAGNGNSNDQTGVSINLYIANKSMQGRFFYNADGEMLIVPQQG
ncbi:MAG TPA: homogentisate 1,2-dioxygenase, partial [Eoetvoesiella sp.]